MPQVVPVSDFRANIKSVSEYTDRGEVVVLTQNGHPKWAMIDYDEWNAVAQMQERSFARSLRETERKEARGKLKEMTGDEARALLRDHRDAHGGA